MWVTQRVSLQRSQIKVLLLQQVMSQLKFGIRSQFRLCKSRMLSYNFVLKPSQPVTSMIQSSNQLLPPSAFPHLQHWRMCQSKNNSAFLISLGSHLFWVRLLIWFQSTHFLLLSMKKRVDSVASPGCNGLICTLLHPVEGRRNQCYLGADSSFLMTASCSYAKHLYSC